jgi:hypothetical protein
LEGPADIHPRSRRDDRSIAGTVSHVLAVCQQNLSRTSDDSLINRSIAELCGSDQSPASTAKPAAALTSWTEPTRSVLRIGAPPAARTTERAGKPWRLFAAT